MYSKQSIRVFYVNEWSQLPNSLLFGAIKIVQIEKFLREFSFSSNKFFENFGTLHVGHF